MDEPDHSFYEPDAMDCSPPNQLVLTDFDVDVLTDTPPTSPARDHHTETHWNLVPPFHHIPFLAPPPASIWQTPVHEPPHSSGTAAPTALHATSSHIHLDVARHNLPGQPFGSVAPLVNSIHLPLGAPHEMSNRPQNTPEVQWHELAHDAGTPYLTSLATLVDEFEQSPTLMTRSSDDPNPHYESTPAFTENLSRTTDLEWSPVYPVRSDDHLHGSPLNSGTTELLEEDQDQTPAWFQNLCGLLPPPVEREATEPLEQSQDQPAPCFLDTTHQQWPPIDPASLFALPEPPIDPRAPHAHPRPPTPPPSRRPRKFGTVSLPATETDYAELPAVQASVQAGDNTQEQLPLGVGRTPRPNTGRSQAPVDRAVANTRRGCGWVPSPRRSTALGSVRCRRERWTTEEGEEEEEELGHPASHVYTKRTRFVVPDLKAEAEKGMAGPSRAGLAHRIRFTHSDDGTIRTVSGEPGLLRSILRNKQSMPYDRGMARHVRRVSVP